MVPSRPSKPSLDLDDFDGLASNAKYKVGSRSIRMQREADLMKRESVIEVLLLFVVVISVALVPYAIGKVDNYYSSSKFPEGAQVITLHGIAKGGIWTQEPVTAFNYWWKDFKRVEEIHVKDNDTPIIFRVTSTDVVHSFAVPLYRIGPYDIKPGEFSEVEFKTDRRLRSTTFICWQYCDLDHEKMKGRLVVE